MDLGERTAGDPRRSRGMLGERLAADFLRRNGYRIHETNFRCPFGELDIVASHGDTLVFVEVRARTGTAFGSAAESVTLRKQQKLRQVADAYLQTRYGGDGSGQRTAGQKGRPAMRAAAPQAPVPARRPGDIPACRIDVVVIALRPDGTAERIELIRDAVGG